MYFLLIKKGFNIKKLKKTYYIFFDNNINKVQNIIA